MKPLILGFTGAIGSGKSTACYLASKCQYKLYTNLNFADPLKDACHNLFGGDSRNWFGTQEDKAKVSDYWSNKLGYKFSTYRRIMQTFGTDIFRKMVHEDFWIMVAERVIDDTIAQCGFVTIGDVRFENEANLIRKYDGVVIRTIKTGQVIPPPTHPSEVPLDDSFVDYTIDAKDRVELLAGIKTIFRAEDWEYNENFAE